LAYQFSDTAEYLSTFKDSWITLGGNPTNTRAVHVALDAQPLDAVLLHEVDLYQGVTPGNLATIQRDMLDKNSEFIEASAQVPVTKTVVHVEEDGKTRYLGATKTGYMCIV